MYYLDENELRRLFRVYAQSHSVEDEEEFVDKVFANLYETNGNADEKTAIDPYDPFNQMPNVQAMLGNQYIRIVDLAGDLLKELLGDGIIDMLIVPDPLKASVLFSLVHFVWDIGKYRVPLDTGKKEFIKYVMTHSYKFSDWVRYFPKGGRGFVLTQAIEDYCAYKKEQDPAVDVEVIRQNARRYADELIDQKIFIKRDEDDRYIIRF